MDSPLLPPLENLERWLADREAAVPGLKPGVAAGVVWANPARPEPTPFSVVYLHGYTATRGEIHPVPDRVAAALGANLYYARLSGHGVGPDGHRSVTSADWEHDAREAFGIGRLLGSKVIVMGTSTGGTLATWLTLGPDAAVAAATVLVSPNLTVKNRSTELLRLPGKEWLLRRLVGPTTGFTPKNELNERFWDHTHHSHSLIPLIELVAKTRRRDFRRWPTPVLVVYDPDDEVVDERVTEKLFSRVPAEKAVLVRWKTQPGDHNHVLAGEALSPGGTERMVELCVDYLRRVLASG